MLKLTCCNLNGLARSSNVPCRIELLNELPERYYSCILFRELGKRSAKNGCSGPAKSSRFDFTITSNDFEDLQAGYQPKTTVCNTEWSPKVIGANV